MRKSETQMTMVKFTLQFFNIIPFKHNALSHRCASEFTPSTKNCLSCS